MDKVTEARVKETVKEYGIQAWQLRRCSLCGVALTYTFFAEHVEFDSNCACTSYYTPVRRTNYDEIVNILNRQDEEVRAQMWEDLIGSGELA